MTLFIAVLACSGRLQAQPAEYESLIDEGVREFAAGNFVEARSLFEHAHAIAPNARTLRALGLCAFELKRYTQAARELDAALKDPRKPLSPALADAVAATLARAKRFIGELHVVTEPADSQVRIDGTARSGRRFEIDAGDHLVVASAPGHASRELTVTVTGMQTQKIELVLPRLDERRERRADVSPAAAASAEQERGVLDLPTQPSTQKPLRDPEPAWTERWWFWTAIGAVVVAAGVSTAVAVNAGNPKPYAGTSGVTLSGQ